VLQRFQIKVFKLQNQTRKETRRQIQK